MKNPNQSAMKRLFGSGLDTGVFIGAVALVAPCILLGGISPGLLGKINAFLLGYLTTSWGWLYLVSTSIFALVCLLIALSPAGRTRLGRDDEKPEFSRMSWFAMLFSAGMGIGLVFWSIAEPLHHFTKPPEGIGGTGDAAVAAFRIFFFHWGVHAWGTYVAVGLPLAYFQFRRGGRGVVSQCAAPLFRRRDQGPVSAGSLSPATLAGKTAGKFVDVLAVWATVLGVVTSLGLGALQITSGLNLSFGVPGGRTTTAVVVLVITFLFILSALSGVKRGIRYLSLLNVWLMLGVLAFFLLFGPTRYICGLFFKALGGYLLALVPMAADLELFDNPGWTRSWTVFYWAWWIAWAPFVGAFIGSISRGRTIREFVLGVMVLPTLFSFVFASALGGTAIHLDLFQNAGIGGVVSGGVEAALFTTLQHLPFYGILAVAANVLIASFFITSADSATFVIGRFSSGGRSEGDPRAGRRLIIFWGSVLGGLAVVLIFSGGLKALQTASIIGAFPFLFIMYLLPAAVIRDLFRKPAVPEKHNANVQGE